MGRPSPEQKRSKRKRQKVKRKLSFSVSNAQDQAECVCGGDGDGDSSMGGVDTDLVEMTLYDDYGSLDGESSTPEYLLKCRRKLMVKVSEFKSKITELQKEVHRIKLASKEENERIRKFYEVIAYGKSRAGQMVRSAMGTTTDASKIIKKLEELYSVSYDSEDDP